VTAQFAFSANGVHGIEHESESVYPGAVCFYIAVLRSHKNFCGMFAVYLVGRGHRTEDTTFKTPNGLFSFVPFQLASAGQYILLHAIFRRLSQLHKNNYPHRLSRRQLKSVKLFNNGGPARRRTLKDNDARVNL
jgi:hypothetical protein